MQGRSTDLMTRTLILGGTGWLGRELAAQFVHRGDEVTCLARGESGTVPDGARLETADRTRDDAYSTVLGQAWDEVVELSYERPLIRGALDALADVAVHWTLVSTVSVYATNDVVGADETATTLQPVDLGQYGQAKVDAERLSANALGDRLLIARPGLIVGPGDPSDRFGYWIGRLALAAAGSVLVPEPDGRWAQTIDVRDLAAWIVIASGKGLVGTVNAVGPQYPLSELFAAATDVAGFTGELEPASDSWLAEHSVANWAGPRSLPLWLGEEAPGFFRRSDIAFRERGGTTRPLHETLRDVLADERQRGLARDRHAGLTRADELTLLDALENLQTAATV